MSNKQLHVFEIDQTDYVVAESEADALRVISERTGNSMSDYEDSTFQQVQDSFPFTIQNAYDDGEPVTKSCREWAAENGKGFLASTEW